MFGWFRRSKGDSPYRESSKAYFDHLTVADFEKWREISLNRYADVGFEQVDVHMRMFSETGVISYVSGWMEFARSPEWKLRRAVAGGD